MSKTSILNSHDHGFQTRMCSVVMPGGEACWGFKMCHRAWIMML